MEEDPDAPGVPAWRTGIAGRKGALGFLGGLLLVTRRSIQVRLGIVRGEWMRAEERRGEERRMGLEDGFNKDYDGN